MPLGRRRRPLMKAAVIGGGAYVAGKHVAHKQQAEADQDAAIADLQDQQAAAPAPAPVYAPAPAAAPAAASDDDKFDKLTKLKDLLDQGILTQAEFDLEKQKILQSM
jgi:hypothetical protein